MEKFHKIVGRQQQMIKYWQWRNTLIQRHVYRFGHCRAVNLMLRCSIQFDTQLEPEQVPMVLGNFEQRAGMPLLAQISLS